MRYADDFVTGFQRRGEAERFLKELRGRLAKFGLDRPLHVTAPANPYTGIKVLGVKLDYAPVAQGIEPRTSNLAVSFP